MPYRQPKPARVPTTIPLLASLSALLGASSGCETASCGTRNDELSEHGARAMRALRQGSPTVGVRELGVATGVLAHPTVIALPTPPPPSVVLPPSATTPDPDPRLTLGEPAAVTPTPPRPPPNTTPTPRAPGAAPIVRPPPPRVQPPPPPVHERLGRMGDVAMVRTGSSRG
jgi:hypothetical protein